MCPYTAGMHMHQDLQHMINRVGTNTLKHTYISPAQEDLEVSQIEGVTADLVLHSVIKHPKSAYHEILKLEIINKRFNNVRHVVRKH